jgi:hypothetical protein
LQITNQLGINLPLAVWLIHDEYDYVDKPNYISVTTLMRPLKQIILAQRIPPEQRTADVAEFIARALGHSIHSAIENAWKSGHKRALKLLGYPEAVIDRIVINPSDEYLVEHPDCIAVYMEQRAFKQVLVNGVTYTIGGKFDFVAEGMVQDFKSTSAFSWLFGTKDDDHSLQGSAYRWLNPEKITEGVICINYIFTDWSKVQARSNPKYPQQRVEKKFVPLRSVEDTDTWVKNKLTLIQRYLNSPEDEMPECNDEELWRSDPAYKYYKNPENTQGRSTKNFTSLAEANAHRAEKGVGVVITVPGEVKACAYCPAFNGCKQKDKYL